MSTTAATMDTLHQRLSDLAAQAKVIENTADAEKRSLNEQEIGQISEINAAFKSVEREIEARDSRAAMEAKLAQPQARITQPVDPAASATPRPAMSITGGLPTGTTPGMFGFRSIGEWAVAARKTKNGQPDNRILNAPSTYGSEGTAADGGYALPPDFRQEIMKLVSAEDQLLSRTDQQITSSNAITLPLDSTTPWQSSGGLLGGWFAEGAAITGSKPALGELKVTAYKLGALVPMTDELLEDIPAMTRYLQRKVPEKLNFLINDAIIAGDGSGKPQGLLSAACKVAVAKETSQTAATVNATNLVKMYNRMYAPCRANAVWLVNQDVEAQLQLLTMPGTNPSVPAYMPPGGFSQNPYATLFGRPVLPFESCSALGTEGDIILADLSQYLSVVKAGGLRSDVSIHLYFDSDHTAFRFVMRVGGQCYWPAAITRKNGSNTLSCVVTLATRS